MKTQNVDTLNTSASSSALLIARIIKRAPQRKLEEFKEVKNLPTNISEERYVSVSKDAIKEQVSAHDDTVYRIMNDAEFASQALTIAQDLDNKISDIETVVKRVNDRAKETQLIDTMLSDVSAAKWCRKNKINFAHFLNSICNTREEKLRLTKNLQGKTHSSDYLLYQALLTGKVSAKTDTRKMMSILDHKETRQANAIVKVLNYIGALKDYEKIDNDLYKVEFDLDHSFFKEVAPLVKGK